MEKTIILNTEGNSRCLPKKETINFLLSYSTALECRTLNKDMIFEFNKN